MCRDDNSSKDEGRLSDHDPVGDLEEAAALEAELGESTPQRATANGLEMRAREWSADQALQALNRVSAAVAGDLHLGSLIRRILDAAVQTLGAERGVIFLGHGGHQGLVPVLARNVRGEELDEVEGISRTILAAARSAPVVTGDAQQDRRFRDVPSVRAKRVRSVACAPMHSEGEMIGIIYLDAPSRAGAFPDQCVRFLESFARLAGVAVRNAQIYGELQQQNQQLRRRVDSLSALGRLDSSSPQMAAVLRRAMVAALVDAPILIIGEEGTERELLARSIHELSPRAMQPFVVAHCDVLDARLRSALLGPPAAARRSPAAEPPRLLRQAERGILFLEELNALDPAAQARLTQLIDEGWLRAAGTSGARSVDVRLIASLRMPTADVLAAGLLRRELHEKLAAIELHIPPLRERPEEIPVLVDRFLQMHCAAAGREPVLFTSQAIELLQNLPWRGNVAELETLVRRVLVFNDQDRIDAAELTEQVRAIERHARIDAPTADDVSRRPYGCPKSLAEQEREAIRNALAHARGNQSAAARILRVHRNTLLRRMKKLGISGEWAAAQRPRPRKQQRRVTP